MLIGKMMNYLTVIPLISVCLIAVSCQDKEASDFRLTEDGGVVGIQCNSSGPSDFEKIKFDRAKDYIFSFASQSCGQADTMVMEAGKGMIPVKANIALNVSKIPLRHDAILELEYKCISGDAPEIDISIENFCKSAFSYNP